MIIGFDFQADYGHFSHPATIYSSLTYPVPPKTAIIGVLAAIAGIGDIASYRFLNDIRYSVVIKKLDGKKNFSFNGVKDALPSIKMNEGFQRIRQRKQFYRELLIAPEYRVYVDFSACREDVTNIMENIKNHRAMYPVYMGINFCLADFTFTGEYEGPAVSNQEYISIDSFIPLDTPFEIEPEKNYSDIRMPTTIEPERIFGGFSDLLVELSGKPLLAAPESYHRVGDHNVVFI